MRYIAYWGLSPMIVLLCYLWGVNRLTHLELPENLQSVRIALLQGSIDQYKKWDQEYVREIKESYAGLASMIPKASVNLVVWPETALPGWYPQDKKVAGWLEKVVRKTRVHHLAGAVTRGEEKALNSAFLLSPDGTVLARYDKMHLVPFGEFVPMQSILGRWIAVLNELGGFTGGEGHRPLGFNGTRLGVGICYESIFPEIPRAQVRNGADILVNLTNDGWYLDTAAPEQHFAMNVFRAVENRRFLVRAANTGISGILSPSGTIVDRTRLGERTVLTGTASPRGEKTLFTRFGDWFPLLCSVSAVFGIAARRKKY